MWGQVKKIVMAASYKLQFLVRFTESTEYNSALSLSMKLKSS